MSRGGGCRHRGRGRAERDGGGSASCSRYGALESKFHDASFPDLMLRQVQHEGCRRGGSGGLPSTAVDSTTEETVRPCARNRSMMRSRSAIDATASLSRKRSEEHTSELQSLMRISYAVFCLKKKKIDR